MSRFIVSLTFILRWLSTPSSVSTTRRRSSSTTIEVVSRPSTDCFSGYSTTISPFSSSNGAARIGRPQAMAVCVASSSERSALSSKEILRVPQLENPLPRRYALILQHPLVVLRRWGPQTDPYRHRAILGHRHRPCCTREVPH